MTNAESELDFFNVEFSGITYVHSPCCAPAGIHLQNFLIFPNWDSIPIKHEPPSAPDPGQPPFYFLSLWCWTHLHSDANSKYFLTSGTFCCLFLKPIRKNAQQLGKAKTSRDPFERLIMPITKLMQGAVIPEWGRLSPRSCQTEGNISALKWPVTESTFMLQVGEEFNHRGPEKPAHGNECVRDLACARSWERKHLFWSQCD